jgi:hypothetical protein
LITKKFEWEFFPQFGKARWFVPVADQPWRFSNGDSR